MNEISSSVATVLKPFTARHYLKTENRAGLSKITVYVKKEIRADAMQ